MLNACSQNEDVLSGGPRVFVRHFQREDLERMQAWEPYREYLLQQYNMPVGTLYQNDSWFRDNVQNSGRRYFAIQRRADHRLIGVISLREIVRDLPCSSARLGLVLGAEFADQGYGTEALALFLDYYFERLGFETMKLDVAAFNGRAIRVYEKCGFVRAGEFYRSSGSTRPVKAAPDQEKFFVKRFNETQVLHYEMELSRAEWLERRGGNHTSNSEVTRL
jgi:RimJ/RimL family protein N-acetyltransferase